MTRHRLLIKTDVWKDWPSPPKNWQIPMSYIYDVLHIKKTVVPNFIVIKLRVVLKNGIKAYIKLCIFKEQNLRSTFIYETRINTANLSLNIFTNRILYTCLFSWFLDFIDYYFLCFLFYFRINSTIATSCIQKNK